MEKLYLNVEEASKYVGVGIRYMRNLLNSDDPPPYLKVGKKRLLQREALPIYFEARQEVRR